MAGVEKSVGEERIMEIREGLRDSINLRVTRSIAEIQRHPGDDQTYKLELGRSHAYATAVNDSYRTFCKAMGIKYHAIGHMPVMDVVNAIRVNPQEASH